ncbi:MAG: hypothetical protein UHZ01_06090, partial [Prevotella sp.]|nr:hypothetical protein [Prevotella sp.]
DKAVTDIVKKAKQKQYNLSKVLCFCFAFCFSQTVAIMTNLAHDNIKKRRVIALCWLSITENIKL